MNLGKINRVELKSSFSTNEVAFIGRLSFESRSISAYQMIQGDNLVYSHFFISKNESDKASQVRSQAKINNKYTTAFEKGDPLQMRLVINNVLTNVCKSCNCSVLLIDVTTFKREELLIFISELNFLNVSEKFEIYLVYSIADNMADWLSSSVNSIRPVIGYSGDMFMKKNTHLIILAGIEHTRIKAIIDKYEPSQISLGHVPLDSSVSHEIFERNQHLYNELSRNYDNISNYFEFSAMDPIAVVKSLEDIVVGLNDYNIIIAALNTKVSTLGVAAFALRHPEVQLCYTEVDRYNHENFSTISDDVILMGYNNVFTSFPAT